MALNATTTWWCTIYSINLLGIKEALNHETLLCLSVETLTFKTCYFKITHSHCTHSWGPVWFFHSYFLRPERDTNSVSGRYVPLGGRLLPASAGPVGTWERTPKPHFAFSLCLDLENHWATSEARFRFPAQTTVTLFRQVKLGSACYHSRRGDDRETFHVLH